MNVRLIKKIKIVKKSKEVGRGISAGGGKTCGRGSKGQNARTGGGTPPGFEGGQTEFYRRFPKRGGGFKSRENLYRIINLEKLEKDPKIIDNQVLNFLDYKLPVKILGKGNLTKKIIIKASAFSQAAQEEIVRLGGEFQTKHSIIISRIIDIFQNAKFLQNNNFKKSKITVKERNFSINSFRNYMKKLIKSKDLKDKLLSKGQKKQNMLKKLEELIQKKDKK